MFEPLVLRDETVTPGLLVVRMGSRTLDDALLRRSANDCHSRWGIWGFSVLEVPHGDFEELARARPQVAERRQMLLADGPALVEDGFPLLPTLDAPHWTLQLASPSPAQFDRVRAHFRGPMDNPSFRARGTAVT